MRIKRIAGVAAVAVALSLATASAAAEGAMPSTGAAYGRHVSAHAQAHRGFSGEMNPGVHHGFAGWHEHEHEHEHGRAHEHLHR